jgi:hypothetical protein
MAKPRRPEEWFGTAEYGTSCSCCSNLAAINRNLRSALGRWSSKTRDDLPILSCDRRCGSNAPSARATYTAGHLRATRQAAEPPPPASRAGHTKSKTAKRRRCHDSRECAAAAAPRGPRRDREARRLLARVGWRARERRRRAMQRPAIPRAAPPGHPGARTPAAPRTWTVPRGEHDVARDRIADPQLIREQPRRLAWTVLRVQDLEHDRTPIAGSNGSVERAPRAFAEPLDVRVAARRHAPPFSFPAWTRPIYDGRG